MKVPTKLIGNYIPESAIDAHLSPAITEYKSAVANASQSGDLFDALIKINGLFPADGSEISSRSFREIKLPPIGQKFYVSLDHKTNNMCPIFSDTKFDSVTQSEGYPARFVGCTIDEVRIRSPLANLHFEDCMIGKITVASGNTFKTFSIKDGTVDYFDCPNIEVGNAEIIGTKIKRCNFDSATVSDTKFLNVIFTSAPSFIEANVAKTVFFRNCQFLDLSLEAQAYYRELRMHMQKNHDEEAVIEFAGLELKAKHATMHLYGSSADWFFSNAYRIVNNFGLQIICLKFQRSPKTKYMYDHLM